MKSIPLPNKLRLPMNKIAFKIGAACYRTVPTMKAFHKTADAIGFVAEKLSGYYRIEKTRIQLVEKMDMHKMSGEQLHLLSPRQITYFTNEQFNKISPLMLSPKQIAAITLYRICDIPGSWISQMDAPRTQALTQDHIISFNEDQIKGLHISHLTEEQISWLKPKHLIHGQPKEIAALSPTQIKAIPAETIWFTNRLLKELNREQIMAMSHEQILALETNYFMHTYQDTRSQHELCSFDSSKPEECRSELLRLYSKCFWGNWSYGSNWDD